MQRPQFERFSKWLDGQEEGGFDKKRNRRYWKSRADILTELKKAEKCQIAHIDDIIEDVFTNTPPWALKKGNLVELKAHIGRNNPEHYPENIRESKINGANEFYYKRTLAHLLHSQWLTMRKSWCLGEDVGQILAAFFLRATSNHKKVGKRTLFLNTGSAPLTLNRDHLVLANGLAIKGSVPVGPKYNLVLHFSAFDQLWMNKPRSGLLSFQGGSFYLRHV